MAVFACAACGAVLTASVSRVALPAHAHQRFGHDLLPALMAPGTYAVDPEPSGPPWRRWREIGAAEAAARGVFAPVFALSFGAPGAIVVAPGDTRGTVLIPDRCEGNCMGVDGSVGPNLACVRCDQPVATRIDDCSLWQAVWLCPHAVRRLPADDPVRQTLDWDTLARTREYIPPIESPGYWDSRWEAAVGSALAHLLAASAGAPVAIPDCLMETFGIALDALLPAGPPARKVAMVGPGLPASEPDIALVPVHPQTGNAWQPPDAEDTVPLAADMWLHLAFHNDRLSMPATGRLPDDVLRDDPLPRHPGGPFRPDRDVFLHTLARLPAVRQPRLRAIYDHVKAHPWVLSY